MKTKKLPIFDFKNIPAFALESRPITGYVSPFVQGLFAARIGDTVNVCTMTGAVHHDPFERIITGIDDSHLLMLDEYGEDHFFPLWKYNVSVYEDIVILTCKNQIVRFVPTSRRHLPK